MPVWQYAAGYAVMLAAIFAIVLMIYASCKTVIDDAEKEAKREAKHYAKILAEHKYQEMLATTTFRVCMGLRIVDEMGKDD
ncbi:MAG: hypothetical protein IJ060_02575 [Oscillospiraceae bacterium]|nr:hypothetical protein [Oscillospiraceae bacterium]